MLKIQGLSRTKKILLLVVLAVVVGAVGYGIWYKVADHPKPVGAGEINYGPPTKTEKKETEQHKKDLESQQSSSDSQTGQATVVITYLSTTEARGYVSGVFEDGGTCTLTLTKGTTKVSGTSTGISDVNKTTCGPISIQSGQLTSGDWNAVLSYKSDTASGSSTTQSLRVP